MDNENDLPVQPTKASKNKPLKSIVEIFTVITELVVLTFLPSFIFLAVLTFPFVILYFYNYYLDHNALPIYQLFIYSSVISVIIILSHWAIKKYGAENFAKHLTLYNLRFPRISGKFFSFFVRGLLYLCIFLLLITSFIIALQFFFTK
jgi:Na+/melibiose symporter-like transporter